MELKTEVILIASVILGILISVFFKSIGIGLENILESDAMTCTQYARILYSKLLAMLLERRIIEWVIIFILFLWKDRRVVLGIASVLLSSLGYFVTMCILAYGIRGVLFTILSLFPHGVVYLFSILLIAYAIYGNFDTCCPSWSIIKKANVAKLGYFIMAFLVAIIGIFLECYVNSILEKMFFHLF